MVAPLCTWVELEDYLGHELLRTFADGEPWQDTLGIDEEEILLRKIGQFCSTGIWPELSDIEQRNIHARVVFALAFVRVILESNAASGCPLISEPQGTMSEVLFSLLRDADYILRSELDPYAGDA
jgi:hypothetical protein